MTSEEIRKRKEMLRTKVLIQGRSKNFKYDIYSTQDL